MSLSPLFRQVPPQMWPRRAIRENHKRLSSTPRMFVGQVKEFFTRPHRQPPQIACLPERRPPKDRGRRCLRALPFAAPEPENETVSIGLTRQSRNQTGYRL